MGNLAEAARIDPTQTGYHGAEWLVILAILVI
jgi:hypothetical protein